MQTTSTKFQRLTSDPAQSKFIILNSTSLQSASIPSLPTTTITTTTTSSILPNSISSRRARPSSALNKSTSTGLVGGVGEGEGEIQLLKSALKECDETRKEVQFENKSLRELVGEVGDWCGLVGEVSGVEIGEGGDGDQVS